MDKEWEHIQQKTFTKWVNNQLTIKGYPLINDLIHGFSDGTSLIHLLEVLTDSYIGKYNLSPKFRLQKIENANKALKFIKERGISLTNIGAEDIVDSNLKLTLGMVWTIVLRFSIAEISEEGLGAKEGLLLWCQNKTLDYSNVEVTDFSYSWKDGCALIHRHYPELLDYYSLDKNDHRGNTALAFKIAEENLGIPQLLDVSDLCDISKPDELSVMTYIAQYFHAFSELNRSGTAGRRVIKFVEVMQSVYDATHDYERRVTKLLKEISDIQAQWDNTPCDQVYEVVKNQQKEFNLYKSTTKRTWLAEKHDVDSLLGNIQTKLKTYKLRTYIPPEGLSLADLDRNWLNLIQVETKRKSDIQRTIRAIKQNLLVKFAKVANFLGNQLNEISTALSTIDGDVNTQLDQVRTINNKIPTLETQIEILRKLDTDCQKAAIEENEETPYSFEDLSYDLDLIRHTLVKKLAFLENQIVSRNLTNLTPAQLEEFESSFRHFDTDNSNTLSAIEFKACLAGLGSVFPDDEFEELFAHVAENQEFVTFEQYINFMVSNTEDKTSPEQLLEAFSVMAEGKFYVTELDLRNQNLPPTIIEYLIQTMPQASDLTEEEKQAALESQEGLVLDFHTYLEDVFYTE